jgi:hypothetical protein
LNSVVSVPSVPLQLSLVLIPVGLLLFLHWGQEEKYWVLDSEIDDYMDFRYESSKDFVLTEYEQLSAEIRYRDAQIMRISYFSFATLGTLVVIFIRVDVVWQPFIAGFGMLISYAFGVNAQVYTQTRDKLVKRRSKIENETAKMGILSISHTILNDERDSYRRRLNSTNRINEFHLYIFIIWLVVYAVITTNAVFGYTLF